MRLAGEWGYGSPLDRRLAGLNINQEELPWWATQVLSWLSLVKDLMGSYKGEWRRITRRVLEGGTYRNQEGPHAGPEAIYALYQDYCDFMENDSG